MAPTPDANGVTTASLGLLSLKGVPMKPQTTGRVAGGGSVALACMCAAVRLSFVSAVCEPVKSMLLTVPDTDSVVRAALNVKCAVPYEAGRRAPPVVVGLVDGTSCDVVRLTVKSSGEMLADLSRLST